MKASSPQHCIICSLVQKTSHCNLRSWHGFRGNAKIAWSHKVYIAVFFHVVAGPWNPARAPPADPGLAQPS
eukprot:3430140-Amphidinium_carterae.1